MHARKNIYLHCTLFCKCYLNCTHTCFSRNFLFFHFSQFRFISYKLVIHNTHEKHRLPIDISTDSLVLWPSVSLPSSNELSSPDPTAGFSWGCSPSSKAKCCTASDKEHEVTVCHSSKRVRSLRCSAECWYALFKRQQLYNFHVFMLTRI